MIKVCIYVGFRSSEKRLFKLDINLLRVLWLDWLWFLGEFEGLWGGVGKWDLDWDLWVLRFIFRVYGEIFDFLWLCFLVFCFFFVNFCLIFCILVEIFLFGFIVRFLCSSWILKMVKSVVVRKCVRCFEIRVGMVWFNMVERIVMVIKVLRVVVKIIIWLCFIVIKVVIRNVLLLILEKRIMVRDRINEWKGWIRFLVLLFLEFEFWFLFFLVMFRWLMLVVELGKGRDLLWVFLGRFVGF